MNHIVQHHCAGAQPTAAALPFADKRLLRHCLSSSFTAFHRSTAVATRRCRAYTSREEADRRRLGLPSRSPTQKVIRPTRSKTAASKTGTGGFTVPGGVSLQYHPRSQAAGADLGIDLSFGHDVSHCLRARVYQLSTIFSSSHHYRYGEFSARPSSRNVAPTDPSNRCTCSTMHGGGGVKVRARLCLWHSGGGECLPPPPMTRHLQGGFAFATEQPPMKLRLIRATVAPAPRCTAVAE